MRHAHGPERAAEPASTGVSPPGLGRRELSTPMPSSSGYPWLPHHHHPPSSPLPPTNHPPYCLVLHGFQPRCRVPADTAGAAAAGTDPGQRGEHCSAAGRTGAGGGGVGGFVTLAIGGGRKAAAAHRACVPNPLAPSWSVGCIQLCCNKYRLGWHRRAGASNGMWARQGTTVEQYGSDGGGTRRSAGLRRQAYQ